MSTDVPKFTAKSCSKQSDDGSIQAGPGSVQDSEQLNIDKLTTADLKLKSVIQQIRTDICSLKAENQLMRRQLDNALQPLVDTKQQRTAGGVERIDLRNVHVNVSSPSAFVAVHCLKSDIPNNLPAIVLKLIFSHVTDTETLLTCRLVCRNWQSIIDNTAALMRKLTFNIIHPLIFLDLTNIVPVVRSAKFDYICPFTDEQLENMVKKIAPRLESVTFNFDKQLWNTDRIWTKRKQIQHLVSVVMNQCTRRLTELLILGKKKDFMNRLNLNSLCHITSLTLEVVNETEDDKAVYKGLISSLHKLSNLTLFNSDTHRDPDAFDFVPVLSPVCEHMLQYPGVLKKFTYNVPGHRGHIFEAGTAGQNLWTKLYLIAGTQNVVINKDDIFNLENLLLFDETYPVNVESCSAITRARHTYGPNRSPTSIPVHAKRTQCCTNLQEIEIFVCADQHNSNQNQNTAPDELSYLWKLKNLRNLTLTEDSGTLSELDFDGPVAAVRRLTVCGDVFDSTAMYSFISVYFPNLVELTLEWGTSISEDLLFSLARLQRLAKLELNDLPLLTDEMFLVLAIAPFTSLKELKIIRSDRLTDKCLLYGIRFISTLQSFTVSKCVGITETGFAAITAGRLNMKTTIERGERAFESTYTMSSTELP